MAPGRRVVVRFRPTAAIINFAAAAAVAAASAVNAGICCRQDIKVYAT